MIEKIRIKGYRKLRDVEITPHHKLNIIVGENEAGKSTLLEAIGLALTGKVNGRPAHEELNPYWFNQDQVSEYFSQRAVGSTPALPEISIEVFLAERADLIHRFYGAHNSDVPTNACCGVYFKILPDEQYGSEIEEYLEGGNVDLLPIEYYRVDWRTFGDQQLTSRPKELTSAVINSRTVRSTSGIDFHLRQILSDHLDESQKARVALAFRQVKLRMTEEHLDEINEQMADLESAFDGKSLGLAMDQTARTSWDASVVPHVADLPFGMVGQGQQAAVKIALAVARRADDARVIMIEEPENHQSHTHLNMLLDRVNALSGAEQQIFITTHSSFVLNRLGLANLLFLTNGTAVTPQDLPASTMRYFQKFASHDSLRMVLADKIVLVEGPSDVVLFERFYKDSQGRLPSEDGIDLISMNGLALGHCLELAKALGKACALLRDNDGRSPTDHRSELEDALSPRRQLFIGEVSDGHTLEPQLITFNDEAVVRRAMRLTERADLATWMRNNKTEGALRLAESTETLAPPNYFKEAIEFIDGIE